MKRQQSNLLIKDKQMIIIHVWRKDKRNKFSTWVENQQAADLRYTQKQREGPEIHR